MIFFIYFLFDCRYFVSSLHYDDVIMGAIASQITSLAIVYSIVYSSADQSKHQSSASLAFVWGIHRGPVNSPHKWPVTRKIFPFDDVIMIFVAIKFMPPTTTYFVWEIIWRLRISDAETPFNFQHKVHCWLVTMVTPSTYLQRHENSFGELPKDSETHPQLRTMW